MTVSETGQTEHVLELLTQAQRQVSSARVHLEDLQAGAAAASRALARAETQTRVAAAADPARAVREREIVAQEMALVARRCHSAADAGAAITRGVNAAVALGKSASASVWDIPQTGMPTESVADLAALGVHIEALTTLLELAAPMAVAASEHLTDVGHVAAEVRGLELGSRAHPFDVDRAELSVTIAGGDLGRAQQDSQHLSSTIETAQTTANHGVVFADHVNEESKRLTRDLAGLDPFGYPQVLGLEVSEALRLGVDGTRPEANQARLERAASIVGQETEASNKAYREATWSQEPYVPSATVAHILVRHGGDMSQAVQDPQMVEHLVHQLGYRAGMDDVYDFGDVSEVIGSKFVNPMVEDPSGPVVVRHVLNKPHE